MREQLTRTQGSLADRRSIQIVRLSLEPCPDRVGLNEAGNGNVVQERAQPSESELEGRLTVAEIRPERNSDPL
jgi:hypothetical protein